MAVRGKDTDGILVYPANTRHLSTVVLMFARRLRRRPNIKITVDQNLELLGM